MPNNPEAQPASINSNHPAHHNFKTRTYTEWRVYCDVCHCRITEGALCSYECAHDDTPEEERPPGTVLRREFQITEVLVKSELNRAVAHWAIEPQPLAPDDGWGIHESDQTGKWFRPASGEIYPLMEAPDGYRAVLCNEHNRWEWQPQ